MCAPWLRGGGPTVVSDHHVMITFLLCLSFFTCKMRVVNYIVLKMLSQQQKSMLKK